MGIPDTVIAQIHDDLRRVAGRLMRRERPGHTLQTTALVNEAYLRLRARDSLPDDKARLIQLAARIARNVLVDHHRRANAAMRGGQWHRVEMASNDPPLTDSTVDVVELADLLDQLGEVDPVAASVAELWLFAGQTVREMSATLGMSVATTHKQLDFARLWLRKRLDAGDDS